MYIPESRERGKTIDKDKSNSQSVKKEKENHRHNFHTCLIRNQGFSKNKGYDFCLLSQGLLNGCILK